MSTVSPVQFCIGIWFSFISEFNCKCLNLFVCKYHSFWPFLHYI